MSDRTFTLRIEGSASRQRARDVAFDWLKVLGVRAKVVDVEFDEEDGDDELWIITVNRKLTEKERAIL